MRNLDWQMHWPSQYPEVASAERGRECGSKSASSQRGRGQSEPLATLIAVSVVCVLISLYVGSLSDVVGESGSERRVEEATMDGIWRDVSEDGVYAAGTDLEEAVSPSSIPDGYRIAVEITVVAADGSERTAGRARLGEPGAETPPEDATRSTRPVSVQRSEGDIRPGLLVVEVWQ